MKTRTLGNSNLEVSALGLGCMSRKERLDGKSVDWLEKVSDE